MAGFDPVAHPLGWRNLITPGGLGLASFGLKLAWTPLQLRLALPEGSLADRIGDHVPALVASIAIALLAIRIFQFVAARRLGAPPSKLMRQIINLLVWAATLGILSATLFSVPLGSLVTTSGMMVAVVGIALKNMISDLATGLSLPVKVGDWIEVDGQLGRVVEVTWRATRLITRSDVTVIIPNTHLMAKPFRNFSQPEPYFRDQFRITLPVSVSSEQAERVMLGAAYQVEAVAALPVPPELRIHSFTNCGVEWELRYYVPDAERMSGIRYKVQTNLLHALRHAGIDLPATLVEWRPAEEPLSHRMGGGLAAFLKGIDLFASLEDEDLTQLADKLTPKLVSAGTAVVCQGDPGDSLFVLKEGLLAVTITGSDGLDTMVGQILPGQFFGEMSLLTGAPRSATVIATSDCLAYEVGQEDLEPLLRTRQGLALRLSEVLAARQLRNAPKLEAARQSLDERKHSLTSQIMGKINAFFRLGPEVV